MNKSPSRPAETKPKLPEIIAKISATKKRAEVLKKVAREAKEDLKRVRKTYKLAKKAAKTVRREFKELKKSLVAAKTAETRSKSAAKTRKQKTVRKVAPVVETAKLSAPAAPVLSDTN